MTDLDALKKDLLQREDVRCEYDSLSQEFSLTELLIIARSQAALTQAQVAAKMNTSQSYIAKLESGQVSPSMKALERFAAATGARLRISFEIATIISVSNAKEL